MDDLKSDGILLYDASRILEIPDRHQRIYDFPIISKAIEYFSSESMAAIIGIGIIGDFMDIVSPRALELALKARIPKGTEELNEQALKIGYELAKLKHGTAEFNA
jgi:2-oxoglutarate ferredoxin oxidoreductase subunit gamma